MKPWAAILFVFALALMGQTDTAAATVQDLPEEIKALEVKPLEGEEKERAVLLIRQLGSASFEDRQKATRSLWNIGKPALELLESAAAGSLNREARMRAKDLVSLIKVGLKPDADPEVVNCVVGFLDRELAVQDRAIQKLVYLQQTNVAEKLKNLVPSESDRNSLSQHLTMALSEAEIALRLGREERFREWVENPATRESQKLTYYYYLWIDGKLDDEISRLKEDALDEIEKAELYEAKLKETKKKSSKKGTKGDKNSAKPPAQNRLKTLVGLLRFLERWDQALEWTDRVYNPDLRRNLAHSILMESGNWQGLASLIVDDEEESDEAEEEDGKKDSRGPHNGLAFVANGYKKALVEYYAGNEEAFEATIGAVEKDIEDEFQKQKRKGAKPERGNQKHAQFLRYTLDFERALKFTSLERDRATFGMLRRHSRYKKLFDVFKLQTYEKRAKYFKGRSRNLRSLQKQVDRFQEESDDDTRDRYVEKRDNAIYDWRQACDLLADLGFDEESELYTRQLYFDMRDKVSMGHNVLQEMANRCAYDSAWELAQLECDRNEKFIPLASIVNPQGFSHEAAQLLDRHFKKKIDDRMERCRKVASLIRSPAVLQETEVDFWEEIGDVDLSVAEDSVLHLFLIWDVEEQALLRRSGDNKSKSVEELEDKRELLQAGQRHEAQALVDEGGSMSNYARAWYAYSRAGNAERARRMRLLFALKFDADDAYEYTSGYNGTAWQSLPFDLYRLYDCLEYEKVGDNCYYMWKMTQNDSKAVVNANQKMVRTQILRLRYIGSPYFDESESDHPTFIEGAIRMGDMKSARRWFKKLSDFQPADSGFVETYFPVFEKLGNSEFVDEMFQKVSADFYEILGMFPDSALHLNNYAWACACAKKNVKNGIEIAKRAVELRPGISGHRDTLAELYFVDGQHDKAIETIRRAIEINPMKPYYVEQLEKFRKAKKAASESAK
jgi:hypothetical protein